MGLAIFIVLLIATVLVGIYALFAHISRGGDRPREMLAMRRLASVVGLAWLAWIVFSLAP